MKLLFKTIIHVQARLAKEKERRIDKSDFNSDSSPILCFHNISNDKDDIYAITRQELESILSVTNHSFFSLDELMLGKKGGLGLTFDDGYESIFTDVYPIMKERGIPFTTYIITDRIGMKGYLNATQIRKLSDDSICTIGSHMCTHRKTREMVDIEIRQEWVNSKSILEKITGKTVAHAALPYGSVASCSKKSIRLALKIGYRSVATTLAVPYIKGKIIPRFVYQKNKEFNSELIQYMKE